MPKTVIQVAKCEPASVNASGQKFGAKIFDTAGTKYSPGPKLFGMFQVGQWYEIFYEEKVWNQNPFNQIITVHPTAPVGQAASPQSAAAPVMAAAINRQTSGERSMEIWINSMMQRASEQRDGLNLSDEDACVEFGEIQKRVYRRLFLNEPAQPRANGPAQTPKQAAYATGSAPGNDDMADEIPF